ncbi:hypothetical protein [Acidimangrovimonas pyrenivorans]|uniref:50S ribosomal protein L35 n=1 Tax=Acidimangrovimonas pyrenivorans TaxID=2030798 RepID=A0ABV7AHI3_9RHOB
MNTDLMFVIGLVVGVLAIPSIFSAFSESRAPRAAAIMVLIAGVLIVTAVSQKPAAYTFENIPDVVLRVVGGLLNGSLL